MSNLRRYNLCGRPVFITATTFNRKPILSANSDIFHEALFTAIKKHRTYLLAWVIMSDHFHLLLDTKGADISEIMHDFKLSFSSRYRKRHCQHRGRIWQLRFWDHIIRDEVDFNRHLDYIHYNPVKHKEVQAPRSYPHSSIHRYEECYPEDWGIQEMPSLEGEFGE